MREDAVPGGDEPLSQFALDGRMSAGHLSRSFRATDFQPRSDMDIRRVHASVVFQRLHLETSFAR
jgi:hypothetical protein